MKVIPFAKSRVSAAVLPCLFLVITGCQPNPDPTLELTPCFTLKPDGSFAQAPVFSPDGKTVATIGYQEIRIWEVASGKNTATFQTGERSERTGSLTVAFGPNSRTLVSGHY